MSARLAWQAVAALREGWSWGKQGQPPSFIITPVDRPRSSSSQRRYRIVCGDCTAWFMYLSISG